MKNCGNRQASRQFRNQAVPYQVVWFNLCHKCVKFLRPLGYYFLSETDGSMRNPSLNNFFKSVERTAADKQYVLCIDAYKRLLRMFAPAPRGYIRNRPLKNF